MEVLKLDKRGGPTEFLIAIDRAGTHDLIEKGLRSLPGS